MWSLPKPKEVMTDLGLSAKEDLVSSTTDPGETTSQSSTSEDSALQVTTVVVNIENHQSTEEALSAAASSSQINITVNPVDASSEEQVSESTSDGGSTTSSVLKQNSDLKESSAPAASTSVEQERETDRRQSCPVSSTQQATATASTSTLPAASSAESASEMNGNPPENRSSRAPSVSSSSSRRSRNGLFGINLDLNFDPSWLVPSNVAGRSISNVLPEWVRHPVTIIPNRGGDNSDSSTRQNNQAHGSSTGGGTASRLLSHYHQSTSGSNWNSSAFPTGSGGAQHLGVPIRTRHTVTSMRSVDEDMDADITAAGRERGNSNSYVIDMDSGMSGWVEDSEESTPMRATSAGASTGHESSTTASANVGESAPEGNINDGAGDNGNVIAAGGGGGNGGASRRSAIEIGLPVGGAPDDGTGSPTAADATTAANERTRAAEILRDAPETRAFINEISRYTTIRPFIVICFLKGVFDHGTSILALLALIVTFSHANSMVKKEVSKQKKRNLLYLSMIVINLAACVAFIYYIFNEMGLHNALAFLPINSDIKNFWSLIWVVAVTDYIAKFGTVFVKICVVALPGCMIPFQKRGKYYLFIEHTSQLYRSFIPVHPWLTYLVYAYEGSATMFGLFLAGLYVFFKITDSIGRFKEWAKALEKLLSNVHYGANPTPKQLDNAGSICPICHDNFSNPTRLACAHIFCEECVAMWLDRERTCPMCRAKVVDDPTYRDGCSSQYIQLF